MIHIVHHPAYVSSAHAASPSQLSKNGLIRDFLRAEAGTEWHEPDAMPRAWIEAVHDPDYVAEVLGACVPPDKERRIGFPVTPAVAERSRRVVGGTYLAARIALERGYAANTAGGSHHARAETGSGYCVLNDLAVAAVRLVEEGTVARVLIVDVDVHQGDGTASLTTGHPGIATYSIHAEKNFPARKARSTLDVPLADGVGDADYLATLEATLAPLLDSVRPDLILYQAGVDPFGGDRLGRLALSEEGLIARERLVARLAIARGIPLASTVGGGYGDDTAAIARRHVTAMLTLGRAFAEEAPLKEPVAPA
ncbi:histone deacetylase family protein [Sphingomonas immobilis]|uniref:Histone deacetylase n=1 Tax=Sphingomonas immobilis TaxID=3063997 RepID=A0ABT8ZZI7_9SPHN|nr:histone deacetylase [Sphingomonas sp. CA1-15]MDO7842997.1 histone deacetylase [Sphingomonas sp. CA1-15]